MKGGFEPPFFIIECERDHHVLQRGSPENELYRFLYSIGSSSGALKAILKRWDHLQLYLLVLQFVSHQAGNRAATTAAS